MGHTDSTVDDKLKAFIEEAKASGGAERANYQLFIQHLCTHLGLAGPEFAKEENAFNDYVFERRITFKSGRETEAPGWIDCYKRGCFILEAKQSAKRRAKKPNADQLALLSEEVTQHKLGHAKRGTGGWDRVMRAAKKQAEDYARALPVEHGYPPFLLVVDVGHAIEVFADFSGQGKNYAHFPDRNSFRIGMDDLLKEEVQERLRAIWTDPHALDPARKSAEVTRDIAERLAVIAKRLEGKHDPKDVAEFLMRCLFTMFAEDVELIPKNAFVDLLEQLKERPETFVPALEHLWSVMDQGGYEPRMNEVLKRFNGALFKNRRALPLDADGIHELHVAAKRDWRDVEPAIFGTLLERALNSRERSKLGAHYTPRAYVERLVIPTIIEPLREDWEDVQARVQDLLEAGDEREALRAARLFHRKLCSTRVLDPACGTGNFLYVSLELMKRLEGEVLETIAELGGQPDRYQDYPDEAGRDLVGQKLVRTAGRFSVDPHQFYGLEINPRAVPIADLVLWIGYLKWQLRTGGGDAITEPVLDAYGTIREQDAILAYDARELQRDETGKPVTVWDGRTMKPHPVTSRLIPDEDARQETYIYKNPNAVTWPVADYVVGNPPFIGNKLLRKRLGRSYVDALFSAYADIPNSVDLVMYWWAKAAHLFCNGQLKGFGLVTTNSIRQVSNRKVLSVYQEQRRPLSIDFAVPDHPWVDDERAAAVRVSMTAVNRPEGAGALWTLTPSGELEVAFGEINPDLTIGVDLTRAATLLSNADISFQGCKLGHDGFLINSSTAIVKFEPELVRDFYGGDEIKLQRQPSKVIDAHELSERDLSLSYPRAYQHLLNVVKPHKDTVDRKSHREKWWRFGEPRPKMRDALKSEQQYLVTVETSRHRFFVFLGWPDVLVDGSVIAIALSEARHLSVLSSRVHSEWSLRSGGRQGKGNDPRYQNTLTFDRFPFPLLSVVGESASAEDNLTTLGVRLDSFRKERLAEHEFLSMTGMYNVLERLRELENGCDVPPLSDAERDIHDAGLVSMLKDIHDEIDRATFSAYGWEDLADRLVGKPGATMPSPHKSEDQEAAEEELLSRLVALNLERQAEEKQGLVRWLRPDYQIPKLGHRVPKPAGGEQIEADVSVLPESEKPKWPADGLDQIRVVRDVLTRAPAPALPDEIAASFDGRNTAKRKARIVQVLETLVATGAARTGHLEGEIRYFLPR